MINFTVKALKCEPELDGVKDGFEMQEIKLLGVDPDEFMISVCRVFGRRLLKYIPDYQIIDYVKDECKMAVMNEETLEYFLENNIALASHVLDGMETDSDCGKCKYCADGEDDNERS